MHYSRWQRHGDPEARVIERGAPLRFFQTVILAHQEDKCLIWPYAKISSGYGEISYEGRQQYVHRVVCEIEHGAPPTPEHEVAHSCGNPSCCAPRHLRWATRPENFSDKLAHGTHNRGERHIFAKLTDSDVQEIRSLAGRIPRKDIARRFNIHVNYASSIIRHKARSW
jgi:hypothetical protein